jgi:phage terminase large subunit-like protein
VENPLEARFLKALEQTTPWTMRARPAQLPPSGEWRIWLLLGGRGAGKSLAAAQFIRAEVEAGRARRIAVVGRSAADIRDVMVEGQSGLLTIAPAHFRPDYEPSLRRLTWPNGAVATTYSGDEPNLLRGPEHDLAWIDELAAFEKPGEVWANLMLGLRVGQARVVVSTTPRPIPLIRDLASRAGRDVALVRMTTYENAPNLAPDALAAIVEEYAGTHLGRQELLAEILTDVPGALWTRELIEKTRVQSVPVAPRQNARPEAPAGPLGYWDAIERSLIKMPPLYPPRQPEVRAGADAPDLVRVVVGVDPSVSATVEGAAETGIIVAAVDRQRPPHVYVMADFSLRGSPDAWARRVVAAYDAHRADRVVTEINQGGALISSTLRTIAPNLPITTVHASRGKQARAEPVAALYEQGRVHHVGVFAELEEQMCGWTPGQGESPDRVDALVWALWALIVAPRQRLEDRLRDMSADERARYFAQQRAILANSPLFRI